MKKYSSGISVEILENIKFPFGFVCDGEVTIDNKKIGTFAYSFNDGDYCLRILPCFQEEFENRIHQILEKETLYKNQMKLLLQHLVQSKIQSI